MDLEFIKPNKLIMAESIAGLVARIIENLESSSLEEIKWIWTVKDELEAIKQTLTAINRTLPSAKEQQSKSKAIKEWLQDLEAVAMDVEDEIELILAQHESNMKVKAKGTTTLYQRLPGLNKARRLKALARRLDEVDHTRKQLKLQEQPIIPPSVTKSLLGCYVTGLVTKKNLDGPVDYLLNELNFRLEDYMYKREMEMNRAPETFEQLNAMEPGAAKLAYRIQNCRASKNRRE